jgi:putative redox protein
MSDGRIILAKARAVLGASNYPVQINSGGHSLSADETAQLGGGNSGPSPYQLLLASLGACTAITLRMYSQRKGWDLTRINVDLRLTQGEGGARIDRKVQLEGNLNTDQQARLAEVAEKTPVTLTLKTGIDIQTSLGSSSQLLTGSS